MIDNTMEGIPERLRKIYRGHVMRDVRSCQAESYAQIRPSMARCWPDVSLGVPEEVKPSVKNPPCEPVE